MTDSSKLDTLAEDRFQVTEFQPGEREAMRHVLAGKNALVFHHRDKDIRMLYEIPVEIRGGSAIVFKPGLKPGKALKADQERWAQSGGGPLAASWLQLKDSAWLHEIAQGAPSVIVLEDIDLLTDALKSVPRGAVLFQQLYEESGRPPVMAFSSVASPAMAGDLHSRLQISEPEVFYVEYFRRNVMFEVLAATGTERKHRMGVRIAQELPGQGIFYCTTVRAAKDIHRTLEEHEIEASLMHGQQRAADRAAGRDEFSRGVSRILVTTTYPGDEVAHHARFAVHYELPATLEQYYYEACSTGPAGKPARSILLFERADYLAQSSRAAAKDPMPAEALQAVRAIRELEDAHHAPTAEKLADTAQLSSKKARLVANLLKDAGVVSEDSEGVLHVKDSSEDAVHDATADYRRHKEGERKRFREIVNYAESGICRQKLLLRFFGREDVEEQCGICDNCRKGKEMRARASARARTRARGADRPWSRGDLVEHDAWGEGEVKQVWGDKLRVHFPGLGEKIIKAEFVRPA